MKRRSKYLKWLYCLIFVLIKANWAFAQCPAPTALISGSQSINQGQSAALLVALTGAAPWVVVVNGQTYSNIISSPYQITVSPNTTTTYTLSSVSNKCGTGTVSGSATVSVCVPATAILTGTQTINQGQSANLSVALTGTSPWSIVLNGQTYTNITTSPKVISVSPNTTTTYTLSSVSNACGAGTVSGSATVSVCNPATATITGTQTIPLGQSTNVSVALTGTSPWSVVVNGQTYANITNSPKVISVSPTANTTYTVSSVGNACGAGTASGSAVVSVCTAATAALSGTQIITEGQSANLSIALTGTSPWSIVLNGQTYTNITTSPKVISVNPTASTTYTISGVSNACGPGTVSGEATITVYAAGCDPMENNDTFQKAKLIGSNNFNSLDLCFNSNSDQDWYKWRINDKTYFILFHFYNYNSTGNYKFSLVYQSNTLSVTTLSVAGQSCDTYIEIIDSDGQTQLAYNDDYNGTYFSQVVYAVPDINCNKNLNFPTLANQDASVYRSATYLKSKAITENGETVYDAKNYILLEPGFKTSSQTTFTAKIAGCNLTPPSTYGLVGYFTFDNGINDSSPYNHNASIIPIVNQSTRLNGNDAYQFIGNGYIKVPNHSSLQFTNALSISLWFNMSNNLSYNTLIAKSDDYPGFALQLYESGGKLKIIFRNSKNQYGNTVNVEIPGNYQDNINIWKHLAVTINIPEISFFVDGEKIYTTNSYEIDFSDSNSKDLIIGGGEYFFEEIPDPINFWGFYGSIDEVRMYNRALTNNEVNVIYNFEK